MPQIDDDDSEEGLGDRELPDEADQNDEPDTVRCPRCGEEIYDNAEQCPRCGQYVEEDPTSRKPIWLIVAAVICLLIVIGWVFMKI